MNSRVQVSDLNGLRASGLGFVISSMMLALGIAVHVPSLTIMALTACGLTSMVSERFHNRVLGYWASTTLWFVCFLFGAMSIAGFLTKNPATVELAYRLALVVLVNQVITAAVVVVMFLRVKRMVATRDYSGPWQ